MEWIDVRGPWPIYIHGMIAITLQVSRNITLQEAREWIRLKGLR